MVRRLPPRLSPWLPLLIGVAGVILSLSIWRLLVAAEHAHLLRLLRDEAWLARDQIEKAFEARMQALVRLGKRWETSTRRSPQAWALDVAAYLEHHPEYGLIAQVDRSGRVGSIHPETRRASAPWLATTLAGALGGLPAEGGRPDQPSLGRTTTLPTGGRGALLLVPLFRGGVVTGTLVVEMAWQPFLDRVLDQRIFMGYVVALFEEDHVELYRSAGPPGATPALHVETDAAVLDGRWHLHVWPAPDLIETERTWLPGVVLGGGLTMALLLALMVHLAQSRQRRTVEAEKANRELASRTRQLKELNDQLDRRVEERTSALDHANQRLQQEIAERHRTEALLRDSEARLVRVIHGTSDGIWDWRVGTDELWFSVRCEEMLGYESGEAPRSWSFYESLLHPDDRERTLEAVRRHLTEGTPYDVEYRLRMKSGTYRWIRDRGTSTPDEAGRPLRMAGSIQDIHEQKEAREALEQSEARLRKTLYELPIPVLLHAEDDEVLLVNRVWTELTGYTHQDIPTMNEWTALAYGNRQASAKSYLDSLYEQDGRVDNGEWEILTRSGQKRTWHFSTAPLGRMPDGRRLIVSTAVDVTDAKRAREEIADKNRELQTLLYITSHDLREPLRAVGNFSQLTLARYGPVLDEKGRDFLQRIVRGAQRLTRLLDDLLVLSRAHRLQGSEELLDGRELVDDVLTSLEHKIKESGARISVAEDLPRFPANKTWARQAIYNLLSNALKFTRAGQAPDVEIAAYHPENPTSNEVGLIVRDRGPGIEARHAERIFQLFQRAVGREVEGTGAGLAIVREVAKRHGGGAWVRPREGGGSEFIMSFRASSMTPGRTVPAEEVGPGDQAREDTTAAEAGALDGGAAGGRTGP